jgi:hypothetical protein
MNMRYFIGAKVTMLDLSYMDKYINEKVYYEVAHKTSTPVDEVRQIMKHVGNTIREVIIKDDSSVSVKLDYIGNIYSNPERRKIITAKKKIKDGLADNSRG